MGACKNVPFVHSGSNKQGDNGIKGTYKNLDVWDLKLFGRDKKSSWFGGRFDDHVRGVN